MGPVSPLNTNPVSPSWTTKPVVGTVCSTGTGVTHSSPTRDSASSGRVRNPSTDWAAEGIVVKFGQSASLKAWVRSASDHRGDAAGGDPAVGRDHGQGIGEEGEPGGVVQVGVADDRELDLDLFGHREGPADRARVDQHPVVDEEGGRPLPHAFAAEGPQHPNLHRSPS